MALANMVRDRLRRGVYLGLVALILVAILVLIFRPDSYPVLWRASLPQHDDDLQPLPGPEPSYNSSSSDEDQEEADEESDEGVYVPGTNYRKGSGFVASIMQGRNRSVCVGSNEILGEAEDLFCLPKPDYDPRMKNPCWWEDLRREGVFNPPTNVKTLSCLPYFHILCCSKSGTTDLFRRITMHPDVVPNFGYFGKERLWWSWGKYGFGLGNNAGPLVSYYKYVKGFNIVARYLEKALKDHNSKYLRSLITLDGSPPDMWDLRGWKQLPQNRNLRQPAVSTPHIMRHLYRDPKFIILVREPVERIYTAYLFHGKGDSPMHFHEDVLEDMNYFSNCLATASDRIECFVNASVVNPLKVQLHYSSYAVYFEEWLKVFPLKHFLFIRTEDYSNDMKGTLLKIFQFLDLAKPSNKDLAKMLEAPLSHHTRQKDMVGPMLEETRVLLKKWFIPWNEELAKLLKDPGYLKWNL